MENWDRIIKRGMYFLARDTDFANRLMSLKIGFDWREFIIQKRWELSEK